MSLLDTLMPSYGVREVDHVAVRAGADATWNAIRAIDFRRVPLVRNPFAIRLVSDRIRARLRGAPSPQPRMGDILGEDPGREIVVGAPGQVAWSLSVAPRPGGSWLTIDVRVAASERAARVRSRRSLRVAGHLARALRRAVGGRVAEELGRAASDEQAVLAGDDLLPAARAQVTHHVDIEAPPSEVWPWLVQMGRRRGGWYSWDLLDNGGVPSADRIIPALQRLAVGDVLPVKPEGEDGFAVLVLEPPRALVLGDPSLLPRRPRPEGRAPRATWAFSLEPIGDAATHLVVRVRAEYDPSLMVSLLRPVVSGVHELMERKQLRTLKRRAEAG